MEELVQKMRLMFEQASPRPQFLLVEEVGTSIPIIQYLQRNTRLPLLVAKPGSRDKISRVKGVLALIEAGRVWIPTVAPWLAAFLDETAAFPGGKYDDQVDALSQALEFLDKRGTGGRRGVSFERTSGSETRQTSFVRTG